MGRPSPGVVAAAAHLPSQAMVEAVELHPSPPFQATEVAEEAYPPFPPSQAAVEVAELHPFPPSQASAGAVAPQGYLPSQVLAAVESAVLLQFPLPQVLATALLMVTMMAWVEC